MNESGLRVNGSRLYKGGSCAIWTAALSRIKLMGEVKRERKRERATSMIMPNENAP